jgi:hypothetical protein
MDVPPPVSAGDVIGYLREHGITLTYDPAAGTLRAATGNDAKTTVMKAFNPGRAPANWKEEETTGRPALAGACARVTSRPARKQTVMGFYCVRGPTAPKSPCLLATEFVLDGGVR